LTNGGESVRFCFFPLFAIFAAINSMNSRKSLCKGIGIESLTNHKENLGALFRGHAGAFIKIGCLSVFETIKDAENPFYLVILPI
jgi:hypothetical protein